MSQEKKYYTTYGGTRGGCGHLHRTKKAALRCLHRDCAGCESQGGYSDRCLLHSDAEGYFCDSDGAEYYPYGPSMRALTVDDVRMAR